MCGIVGVIRFDGQAINPEVLGQMTTALAHRGPDGQGLCHPSADSASVGLGHARLKIIDLSDAAGQPMSNEDGSLWVVFNGEIYNFRELRASLKSQGYQFRTSSDTEVLLRIYEREGERCLNKLDGMFAFAVWDARQRRLVLARDRVGKKPLFYYSSPTMFAFASEIKALLRHPEIVPEVACEALGPFFLYGYVPTPGTFYHGISQLPPGYLLRVDFTGEVRTEEYWDVPLSLSSSSCAPSEAEAMARVRELTEGAVRRRLITDVPLGAFLSGGIDSSIVVGLMSRFMPEPVRTFSIGFSGDPHFDETSYARLAARHFGSVHTEFVVRPSAVELVDRLVWHHDGPFADSSAIPTYLLAQLTREHVTVALTGDGGDELFAGYLRFYATLISERVPRVIRQAARRFLCRLPEWGNYRGVFRRVQKFASSAALPFEERFTRWIAVFYEDLPRLLPSFHEAGNGYAPQPLAILEPYLRRCGTSSALTRLLYVNLKTYLLDDLLVKMDRCSMAHGLETRSPFLDRELLEYVFGLPDHMKLRWGGTKMILRRAFADLLPPQIVRRGKMGFGVPLRKWFASDLREFVQDFVMTPHARLRQYVDQRYVQQLWQEHLSGYADHSNRVWTLLTFEVWLRQLKAMTSRVSERGAPTMQMPVQANG